MARSATVYTFIIALSDSDRHVYEELDLRVALHPSETLAFLLTRVLAYCLEYEPGIAFSRGLSAVDEPALEVLDLTGRQIAWIDVGLPSPERLHKASKAAERVAVYTHKRFELLAEQCAGARIHKADAIVVRAFEPEFMRQLEEGLERRVAWSVSVADGHVYVSSGARHLSTVIEEHRLQD